MPSEPPLPPDLDAQQNFAAASSYQVRDELQGIIARDLLGPYEGAEEQFPPNAMGPRERYLVGMLGPKVAMSGQGGDRVIDPDSTAEGDAGGEGSAELPETMTTQNLGRIWASSMGVRFAVSDEVDVVVVTASWGRYVRRAIEDEDSKKRTIWAREPVEHTVEARLDGDNPRTTYPLSLDGDPDLPGVRIVVEARHWARRRVVVVTLINSQDEPQQTKDTAWLFQTKLVVTALDGAAEIFKPVDDAYDGLAVVGDDQEELHLRLLYRHEMRFASGHNVAVHPSVRSRARQAYRLETTWLPVHDVPATIAPDGADTALADVELGMDVLATATAKQLETGLFPMVEGYQTWLDDRGPEIAQLPATLRSRAEAAVERAREAAMRLQAGLDLLTDPSHPHHARALVAFHFANRAMAMQRRHTEIGRLRADDEALTFAAAEARVEQRGPSAARWRPFQLAFVLINLPSLVDPDHPERAADSSALVDLLFFPTGGGKTEAYLGLTAFTFAIRRLQGTLGSGSDARSSDAGVAVLMRYTLRLLTAQQFQRAAALVCATEKLRRDDEQTWGTEPFRIGLWVGGGVSPNWYTQAAEQVAEAREAADDKRANVLQTLACPWCGTALSARRDVVTRTEDRRVLLFCPNAEGAHACPFAKTRSREGLPIVTVDEEIYRLLPALVIATVDKLAQLPWRGFAGLLFGRTRQWCPRHGFRHDDLDGRVECGPRHQKKGKLPAVESRPVPRQRPPDLIIQDELHLISGALGTTVGLFESAVDELCSWVTPTGRSTGPKIVASTATTKRASEQVRGVFGRDLRIFPPQVTDVRDTFFSKQVELTEKAPGRRYLGVCAHGVRLKSAEIRIAEILLLAGQTVFDAHGEPADPFMTLVGYFNATRELAGMRRYVDDDVTTRVRRHGTAKALSNRVLGTQMLSVQELTSRISSGDISDVLRQLEVSFDPELDTMDRRRGIAENLRRVLAARRTTKQQVPFHPLVDQQGERARTGRVPVDVVLATSMLQVGVDVSRFGLMLVVGQPKNTAEYIQASSRVGRDAKRPGLVVTLYNWTRPRDLAHFEDFEHYHATFYRQVEALSVTPYTRRALDRGTAASFVAAVRQRTDDTSRNADAATVDLDAPGVTALVKRLLTRAEFVHGSRGREYLAERIARLRDVWNKEKSVKALLGYQQGKSGGQTFRGLLTMPGEGPWGDTTVGMSMRETENEINLLVPGSGDIFLPLYDAPEYVFTGGASSSDPDDRPEGDELGDTALAGAGGGQV
jgi:hypothetical protein